MKYTKQDPREVLRFRALELSKAGWKQVDIAEALGRTPNAVYLWLKKAREEGPEALRAKRPPGRPPRLDPGQLEQLDHWLVLGAEAHGFEGERWTAARVATVIKRHFGVTYSDGHTCKILKKIGWSQQRPARRSTRRNEEEVAIWQSQRWEELKKKPGKRGARSRSSTSPASSSFRS